MLVQDRYRISFNCKTGNHLYVKRNKKRYCKGFLKNGFACECSCHSGVDFKTSICSVCGFRAVYKLSIIKQKELWSYLTSQKFLCIYCYQEQSSRYANCYEKINEENDNELS